MGPNIKEKTRRKLVEEWRYSKYPYIYIYIYKLIIERRIRNFSVDEAMHDMCGSGWNWRISSKENENI